MSEIQTRSIKIPIDDASVSAVIAQPHGFEPARQGCVVLAHGAGADMHHPFVSYFHEAIARAGWTSVKFNFLYKEQGRRAPDPPGKLESTFIRVVDFVRRDAGLNPGRLFLAGKSMGGRIASQIVAGGEAADGLVFLGYPLHAPNRFEKLRSEHLARIGCPMLFVEGTHDPFCNLDLLSATLRNVSAPAEVYRIEGGNHDFRVPKKLGKAREEIWEEVAGVICERLNRWG